MLELGFDLEVVESKHRELAELQTEINRLHARQAELIDDLDPVMLCDLTGSRTVRDWAHLHPRCDVRHGDETPPARSSTRSGPQHLLGG